MTQFYSTRQAAAFLGMKPDALQKAVWLGRVAPPGKSPGGQYLWMAADIERAGWVLLHRSVDITLEEQAEATPR